MKGFLDTSVLVPLFYGDHIHHLASLNLFTPFNTKAGCCAAHSLVEVLDPDENAWQALRQWRTGDAFRRKHPRATLG